MKPKTIIITVIVILLLIILIQNTQTVTLHVFFWKLQISQIVFIPGIFILGLISGFVSAKLTRQKKKSDAATEEQSAD